MYDNWAGFVGCSVVAILLVGFISGMASGSVLMGLGCGGITLVVCVVKASSITSSENEGCDA